MGKETAFAVVRKSCDAVVEQVKSCPAPRVASRVDSQPLALEELVLAYRDIITNAMNHSALLRIAKVSAGRHRMKITFQIKKKNAKQTLKVTVN